MRELKRIERCKLIDLPQIADPRGNQTSIEAVRLSRSRSNGSTILYDIPGGAERGGHAHKELQQLIIAMSGSFDVVLDDGYTTERLHLNRS